MMETIVYPISTNYRKEWGEWEAVREIVQNAIDSNSKVIFDYQEDTKQLYVEDQGPGFELRHLLIGETEKDGQETIGKFGEGLKLALLTLVSQGKSVQIQSNDLCLYPKLVKMFDADVLAIDYERSNNPIIGTWVLISNIEKNYRDHFVSLDKTECFKECPLLDSENLYIKGIYVKPMPGLCGYNLVVERENPMSGDVDSYAMHDALERIIKQTCDRDYIYLLLENATKPSKIQSEEFFAGRWTAFWHFAHKNIWLEEAEKLWGKNLCIDSDSGVASTAAYYGFTILKSYAYFLKGLLPTDRQVLASLDATKKTFLNAQMIEQLSSVQKASLKSANFLLSQYEKKFSVAPKLKIAVYEKDEIQGEFDPKCNTIYLNVSALQEASKTLLVIVHELVHYRYSAKDMTLQFLDGLQTLWSTLYLELLKENGSKFNAL